MHELPEYNMNINGEKQEVLYLKREKQQPPSLNPQKHPHGAPAPMTETHPQSALMRPHTHGNDNSSVNRQSRCQSTRPDPIPGAPYAGASSQRLGSASLRKYNQPTLKGSGQVANAATGMLRVGPPSPFLSPLQQQYARAHVERSKETKAC